MNKRKEITITGRDVIIAVGQFYNNLHDQIKDQYDKSFPVSILLTEPIFGSLAELRNTLALGKKRYNDYKAKQETKEIIDNMNLNLTEEEKIKIVHVSPLKMIFSILAFLFSGGSTIYVGVILLTKLFRYLFG